MIDRRQLLRAALFVAAAPVIVKASSLMKVRALPKAYLGLAHVKLEGGSIHFDPYDEESLRWAIMETSGLRIIETPTKLFAFSEDFPVARKLFLRGTESV